MPGIVSYGHATPPRVETSDELEHRLGLPAGWVEQRLGVRSRRLATTEQATSDLAVEAGQKALNQFFKEPPHPPGLRPADLPLRGGGKDGGWRNDIQSSITPTSPPEGEVGDAAKRLGGWGGPPFSTTSLSHGLLILATSTPDHPLPPTAPLVAHRLGLHGWGAIDLAGACSGFLYALAFARSFPGPVLVIAANVLNRRVNSTDAGTSALFADGAGAVLLEPSEDAIRSVYLGSDGSRYDAIQVPAGGSRTSITSESLAQGHHFMQMKRGPDVFRAAVLAMAESGERALQMAGITASEIDWWIPHQANARLIAEAGKRLGFEPERTVNILAEWGNSSAASIPTAISIAAADGRLKRGQTLLLTAAGAGMIKAGIVLKW